MFKRMSSWNVHFYKITDNHLKNFHSVKLISVSAECSNIIFVFYKWSRAQGWLRDQTSTFIPLSCRNDLLRAEQTARFTISFSAHVGISIMNQFRCIYQHIIIPEMVQIRPQTVCSVSLLESGSEEEWVLFCCVQNCVNSEIVWPCWRCLGETRSPCRCRCTPGTQWAPRGDDPEFNVDPKIRFSTSEERTALM